MQQEKQTALDFDIGSTSDLGSLTKNDLDEPIEVLAFSYQLLIGALVIILGVPFTPTYPLSFYEDVDGVPIGSRWWIGVLYLAVSIIAIVVFLWMKGEHFKIALIRTAIAVITFFLFGMIANSLWEHGTWLWNGYYSSLQAFFVSDVIVSIICGLVSVGIVGIIPARKKYYTNFQSEFCDDRGNCHVPLDAQKNLKLRIIY